MGLVRFESDDHHSQIVLGTHDIEEITPRLGDDQHVDIRIRNGRVFTVRETVAQVDAKLVAHGASHLHVKRIAFAKAPVSVEQKPQAAESSDQVNATPEPDNDATPTVVEQPAETPAEPPVETPTSEPSEQPIVEPVTATPEAQPAAEVAASQPDEAGTESAAQ